MKPYKNPEELYAEAIKLEQNQLKGLDVPVRLKKEAKASIFKIGSLATGIAASVLFAWIWIHPKITQHRVEAAKVQLSESVVPSTLINSNGDAMPLERFNASAKNITATNETIVRFNQKLKKFKTANS